MGGLYTSKELSAMRIYTVEECITPTKKKNETKTQL